MFKYSHHLSSKFNLLLIGTFYVTHAARVLQSHDLSGKGIKLWITYILFWPHKDMEGLHGWVIGPMPGPPPRQHKHERQYTPRTNSVIPTRRIWNDDYDGQMIFGDLGGLKFPDICPDRGSNPGPLRDKRACYHLLHSGGRLNILLVFNIIIIIIIIYSDHPRTKWSKFRTIGYHQTGSHQVIKA